MIFDCVFQILDHKSHDISLTSNSNSKPENQTEIIEFCIKDMISGLLQLDILKRLRYILEVIAMKQSFGLISPILEIISRISRHSKESALKVFESPRLMVI